MNQQGIILPNASLFLVHRGWNANSKKTQSINVEGEDLLLDCNTVRSINRPWPPQIPQSSAQEGDASTSGSRPNPRKPSTTRSFEFVNATRPDHSQHPEVQKLVRSHVKNGVKRGPNARKASQLRTRSSTEASEVSESNAPLEKRCTKAGGRMSPGLSVAISGAASPFYGNQAFSVVVGPRSESLLSYYFSVVATSWYPLEAHLTYNPVKAGWFPLAMKDEFLFRSVLFSSASHIATKSGSSYQEEPTALVVPIFRHLNQRLKANPTPSDTTIGIVACLAMVEMSLGHYDKWKLHMAAIKEMIRLRGGLSNVEASLQTKLSRADVEGASDTMTALNLEPLPRLSPPIHANFPDPSVYPSEGSILSMIHRGGISTELQSTFLGLDRLTRGLLYAISHNIRIDPRSLDEDMVQINHDIITLMVPPSFGSSPDLSNLSSIATRTLADFNEAAGLAALLYTKYLARPIYSIHTHVRPIVKRLASLLSDVSKDLVVEETSLPSPPASPFPLFLLPFLLWLHFIGGIAASGVEAELFADGIVRLVTISHGKDDEYEQYKSWQDIKRELSKVLWFPLRYDKPGMRLWDAAVTCSPPSLSLLLS